MTWRSLGGSALALLGLLLAPPHVAAQTTSAPAPSPGFFTDANFHLGAQSFISSNDEAFAWDAHYGGDVDLIDYGVGRFNFLADYHVVLGKELRRFDPTQGNYVLEGSTSARFRGLEAALVFHHVSRHFSDRPKRFSIDWNEVGVRVTRGVTRNRLHLSTDARMMGVIRKTFVDYRWEGGAGVTGRYTLDHRWAAVGALNATVFGVDETVFGRGSQKGVYAEGGIRLTGRGALLDGFLAVERRVDADALELHHRNFVMLGFRMLSR